MAAGFAIILLSVGLAAGRIKTLVSLLAAARPAPERRRSLVPNLKYEVTKVLGQRKLFQWSGPGLMHAFTFWGFLVVQVTLVETIGELFSPEFKIPIVGDHEWLGFVQDLFFVLVSVALVTFAVIRLGNSPERLGRRSRFFRSHMTGAFVILAMILGVVATVLVVRAARWALGTLPYPRWAFLSRGLGGALDGLSHSTLRWLEDGFLLAHIAVVFAFLVVVMNSKHLHIFTSPLNVLFGRQPLALGRLRPLHIDPELIDEETVLGVGAIEQFSWKQLLDAYTCTECGRCQSVCPAWNTGKDLNPKLLMMGMRDHLFEKGPLLLGRKTAEEMAGLASKSLVPDVVSEDVLWACVTCGACVYECPVDIEHVDAIVDMRRYQVMMESKFPPEAGVMLRNLENSGNPWGAPASARLDWAKGIEDDLIVLNGKMPPDVEYLYWVGCAGAFDDRAKKSVRAFAELLLAADVGFAVLGPQETCTGDPARRVGNEYLYQEIATKNVQMLKSKGVRKIVTACPHCFNALRNEYPDFGGDFEVIHHTQLLEELVRAGRLVPSADLDRRITYHDPCYLARHNGVTDAPREVLDSVPGLSRAEMKRSRGRTFCCGAGGGRMWMEESAGKRINIERVEEVLATDPEIVSVGCPYCMIMMDDAVKDKIAGGEASESVQVMDVAQVLARSVRAASGVAK
ncbi:MAG: (Fe-S)-binding protein [Acidobacteria bacterium]|nr:(Fe-S)-binding protein [Acidobacteriota bacterium]